MTEQRKEKETASQGREIGFLIRIVLLRQAQLQFHEGKARVLFEEHQPSAYGELDLVQEEEWLQRWRSTEAKQEHEFFGRLEREYWSGRHTASTISGVPEHAGPNGGHAEPPRKSRGSRGGERRKRNLCNAYPHWTMQGKLERLETREVMLQAQ